MKQIFTLVLMLFLQSAVVFGQAARTWVSGVGDDVNPCSRTAPCKTFAGAISKTADRGEINTLDPGGYGAVTITKSITINGEGTNGSILSAAANGVIVNGANIRVVLKNININGAGTGVNGVRFLAGDELHLENVTITGLAAGAAGLLMSPTLNDRVVNLDNVKIFPGNKSVLDPSGAATAGIRVDTSGNMMGLVKIHTKNTVIEGAAIGVNLINNGWFSADNTVIQNTTTGVLAQRSSKVILHNSEILFNGTGLSTIGASSEIAVKGTNISFNSVLGSGKIYSYGNNMTHGNTTDYPLIVRNPR